MPIFESKDGRLTALRPVRPGPDLYEKEIEDLIWENIEQFYASDLFRIGRQVILPNGGRPDLVALREDGGVVVFEVKRSIERSQLAQCLEYAGWAKRTNLDELSKLYHRGPDAFFADWQEYCSPNAPLPVAATTELVLVAQDFDKRTIDALGFLTDSGVPVRRIPVSVYADNGNRRFFAVDSDYDDTRVVEVETPAGRKRPIVYTYKGRRLALLDLMEAGFLRVGEPLEYRRVRDGVTYTAELTADGALQVPDGTVFDSLSRAATALSGVEALPGWDVWAAPERGGRRLLDIRQDFLDSLQAKEASEE